MKRFALAALLGAQFLMAQVSVGISIGPPPRPRVVRAHPVAPGADYVWVDGYWFADGRPWKWHDGYWTRPPYAGARWIGPRYESNRFYNGYWEGGRGKFDHDHRWDRDRRERDHRWDRDHR